MTQVHQSRWGYHPCDYTTHLLLKELNQFYLGALRRFAEWKRWRRKQPQNRMLCKKRRNAWGQVIGKEILGPRPEPILSPVFTRREEVRRHRSDPGQARDEGPRMERVCLAHSDIPEVYRKARTPAEREELVVPLPYSDEEIRRLIAACRASGGAGSNPHSGIVS